MGSGSQKQLIVLSGLSRCQPLLGTYVEITLGAESLETDLIAASEIGFDAIKKVQHLMSFHDPESELSQINMGAFSRSVAISKDTYTVLKTALDISKCSDGLYDVTTARYLLKSGLLPGQNSYVFEGTWSDIELSETHVRFHKPLLIDLGGIAKGYAVDCAFEAIMNSGFKLSHLLVNAGGDMKMLNWEQNTVSIRYQKRFPRDGYVDVLMENSAVATSGPQYGGMPRHIIDPRCGGHSREKKSVSIFADTCVIADALTKLLYIAPHRTDVLTHFKAQAISVDRRGTLKRLL